MSDKASGMKSAYELALERLERQGIERPREESLTDAVRQQMAEVRSKAQARIAELEILHQNRLKSLFDPAKRQEEEDDYVRERQRIENDREARLDALRGRS